MLKEGLYQTMETDEKTNHEVPRLPGQPKETSWGQMLCCKIYLALVIPLCALVRSIVRDVIYIVLVLLEVYIFLRLLGTFGILYVGKSFLLRLIYSACCGKIIDWINEGVLGEFVKWCLRQETYFHRFFTGIDCSAHRQYTGERLKCDLKLSLEKKIKNKSMIQLDDVIQRYARQKLLMESNEVDVLELQASDGVYICQVDWTALTIEHKVTKFSPKVKDGTVITTPRGDVQTGTQWTRLLSCYYDNQAKSKQSYTFRESCDTTSRVDVDLKQFYTINQEVCAKLNFPHDVRVGIDNTVSLNKVKGEVFQKTHTWELNTRVEVEPSSRAHVQLLARRECSVVEFEIRTTLYNPKETIHVTYSGMNKNRSSFKVNIENLHQAFRLVEDGGVLTPEENECVDMLVEKWLDKDGVEHSATHPQIITRGTCVYLSWTDQKVDIKTSPLSMDEK